MAPPPPIAPTTSPMAIPNGIASTTMVTARAVAPLAPAPAGIDERRVGLLQRVGEALVDPRAAEALVLPQRDHEQLARGAVVAADEDDAAVDEIAHVHRAACGRLRGARRRRVADASRRPGLAHAAGDLGPVVEAAQARADALAEALDGMVGDRDGDALAHRGSPRRRASEQQVLEADERRLVEFADAAHGQQHARHERLAPVGVLADRQRSGRRRRG